MSISLEGVLPECGMWGRGIGSPAPDVPKMVAVLGGKKEESSRPEKWDPGGRCVDFSKQIRAAFEECRVSNDTTKERSKGISGGRTDWGEEMGELWLNS